MAVPLLTKDAGLKMKMRKTGSAPIWGARFVFPVLLSGFVVCASVALGSARERVLINGG